MQRLVNARELGRRVLLEGREETERHIAQALRDEELHVDDFSIRDLAESLIFDDSGEPIGRQWIERLDPRSRGGFVNLMEAFEGVDVSAFSNITGQIFYNATLEGYNQAAFVGDQLFTTIPTKLSGEKIPGVTAVATPDGGLEVHPGMPYPQAGFAEDYIETPATVKNGLIISVEKETIFFDRTAQVLERARQVGEVVRRDKEKRQLKVAMGRVNNFKWRGTSYNTYQTATPWINVKATNGVDAGNGWTNVDASEQLFADMLEPNISEPITIEPNAILHMPARRHHWRRVIGATELRTITGAETTIGRNTVDPYTLIESKFAYRILIDEGETAANAADYWFHGNFKKAFVHMENWPLTVVQAPLNSEAEFSQDVVVRWKASERGVAAVREPRAAVWNYEAKTL